MLAADLRINSPCLLFQHDPTEMLRGMLTYSLVPIAMGQTLSDFDVKILNCELKNSLACIVADILGNENARSCIATCLKITISYFVGAWCSAPHTSSTWASGISTNYYLLNKFYALTGYISLHMAVRLSTAVLDQYPDPSPGCIVTPHTQSWGRASINPG